MKKTIIFFGILLGLSMNAQSWNLNGNSGTNPSTQFLGTIDNKDLVFKTNGSERIRIKDNGNLFVGDPWKLSHYNADTSSNFISVGKSAFYLDANGGSFKIVDGSTSDNYFRIHPSDEYESAVFLQESDGRVVIGSSVLPYCSSCSGYRLFVKDGIKTEKVKVEFASENGWADYVFEDDYELMSLNELKNFISENKHLPEVPTAKEVVENGLELKEFSALLLKKLEELTIHTIQLNEIIEAQNLRIKNLENKKQ